MSVKYLRYTLETKLRVVETARNDGNWERIAAELGVKFNTARHWVRRHVHENQPLQARPRGGCVSRKVIPEMVHFLLDKLRGDPDLTLCQLTDMLEAHSGVRVTPQTVKNHVDGSCFTLKQMHKKPQYMNTLVNEDKRRDFLVQLQEYQAAGKTIWYMDETNFNLWATRTRGRSLKGKRAVKKVFAGGGQNMHVNACISERGLVYFENRFGSNRYMNTNEFIRSLLRHVSLETELTLRDVVLVLDNAPCHCRAEQVFEEPEFEQATLLRLGPYSSMLNPIENVFSSFKSSVKAFMRENRLDILRVPEGVTMKDHRQSFLHEAAHTYMPQAASAAHCRVFYRHTAIPRHGEQLGRHASWHVTQKHHCGSTVFDLHEYSFLRLFISAGMMKSNLYFANLILFLPNFICSWRTTP